MDMNNKIVLTKEQKSQAIKFVLGTMLVMIFTGVWAFHAQNKKRVKDGKKKYNLVEFLNNGGKPGFKTILAGMAFGFTFGFIDNSTLWLGMEYLTPIFKKMGLGGPLTSAGLGNAYGDFLGSSFGTFVAILLKTIITPGNVPIWADCLGVTIGCILGVFIPRAITGKK
jgi:hypothetical protein